MRAPLAAGPLYSLGPLRWDGSGGHEEGARPRGGHAAAAPQPLPPPPRAQPPPAPLPGGTCGAAAGTARRRRLAPLPQRAPPAAASLTASVPLPHAGAADTQGRGALKCHLALRLEQHVQRELVALGMDEKSAAQAATAAPGSVCVGVPSWGRVQVWEGLLRMLGKSLPPSVVPLMERALAEYRWFLRGHRDEAAGAVAQRAAAELQRELHRLREEHHETLARQSKQQADALASLRQDLHRCQRLLEVRTEEKEALRQRLHEDHRRAVLVSEALHQRQDEDGAVSSRLRQLEVRLQKSEQTEEQLRHAEQEVQSQRDGIARLDLRCLSAEEQCAACQVQLAVAEETARRQERELAAARKRLQQAADDHRRAAARTEQLARELRAAREPGLQASGGRSALTPRPHWGCRAVVDALWHELISRRSQGGGGHRGGPGRDNSPQTLQSFQVPRQIFLTSQGPQSCFELAVPDSPSVAASPMQGAQPAPAGWDPDSPLLGAGGLLPAPPPQEGQETAEDTEKRRRLEAELSERTSSDNADLLAGVVARQRSIIAWLHSQVHTSKRVSEFLRNDPQRDFGSADSRAPTPPDLQRRVPQFFVGEGTDCSVPRCLQWQGKVVNRQLPRSQLREWMGGFWAAKCGAEARSAPGQRPAFGDFVYEYLGGHRDPQQAVEQAYGIVDGARRACGDVDCTLFIAALDKQVGDEVCDYQFELLDALRAWFERCEKVDAAEKAAKATTGVAAVAAQQTNGRVSKRVINRELSAFFPPSKRSEALLQLKAALHAEQPGRTVEWGRLFQPSGGRAHGSFVSLVRQQHLDELRATIADVQQLLVDVSEDGRSMGSAVALAEALQESCFRLEARRLVTQGLGCSHPEEVSGEICIRDYAARLRLNYSGPCPYRRCPAAGSSAQSWGLQRTGSTVPPRGPSQRTHSLLQADSGSAAAESGLALLQPPPLPRRLTAAQQEREQEQPQQEAAAGQGPAVSQPTPPPEPAAAPLAGAAAPAPAAPPDAE
eukprot:TRINITY_DN8436_c0_g2_i1.p1 TRINITY_DN8436_c0_g2~~TRINITY_DN8436_c0_g2_i1.p1  ORF type:complete len:1029 (+),score=345.74 TRINITY_DN8436_c0_g2_i1:71-3088(+)